MPLTLTLPAVRVDEKLAEDIKRAAQAKDMTVSRYIRQRLARAVILDLAEYDDQMVANGNDGKDR